VTVFVDHTLAARLEASSVALARGFVAAAAARFPERGAGVVAIAGGVAAFVAPGLPPSRAAGLGMSGPVTGADVDALVDFYRGRDAAARIFVSPFADASLFARLAERGFGLVSLDTVLVRRLDPSERFAGEAGAPPLPAGVAVRPASPADAAAWVRTSLEGFAGPGQPAALDRAPIFEAAFDDPASVYFAGTVAGSAAGGGALHLHGPTAYLFAASTVPAFRGRGVQGAIIAARLARARDAGCDLAFSSTAAGSASQRNFERAGFTPACSQALLAKPLAGGLGTSA
jgi:GNAT superfamily N-acetyltransferase